MSVSLVGVGGVGVFKRGLVRWAAESAHGGRGGEDAGMMVDASKQDAAFAKFGPGERWSLLAPRGHGPLIKFDFTALRNGEVPEALGGGLVLGLLSVIPTDFTHGLNLPTSRCAQGGKGRWDHLNRRWAALFRVAAAVFLVYGPPNCGGAGVLPLAKLVTYDAATCGGRTEAQVLACAEQQLKRFRGKIEAAIRLHIPRCSSVARQLGEAVDRRVATH